MAMSRATRNSPSSTSNQTNPKPFMKCFGKGVPAPLLELGHCHWAACGQGGFCSALLTSPQEQGGPEVNVQHHVVGACLVVSSHVVLRHPSEPVQGQRQQLREDKRQRRNLPSLSLLQEENLDHSPASASQPPTEQQRMASKPGPGGVQMLSP